MRVRFCCSGTLINSPTRAAAKTASGSIVWHGFISQIVLLQHWRCGHWDLHHPFFRMKTENTFAISEPVYSWRDIAFIMGNLRNAPVAVRIRVIVWDGIYTRTVRYVHAAPLEKILCKLTSPYVKQPIRVLVVSNAVPAGADTRNFASSYCRQTCTRYWKNLTNYNWKYLTENVTDCSYRLQPPKGNKKINGMPFITFCVT